MILRWIKDLYETLRLAKWAKWERVLPFSELLFDRWEYAKWLDFGEGSSVYHNVYIYGKVDVGMDTWIGPFVILDGSGALLTIGDRCSIGPGVKIYTHSTVELTTQGKPKVTGPVIIGNNTWIGANTVIGHGITIGSRCVIGANSVVLTDIPDDSRAHGAPATVRTVMGKKK